MKEKYITYAKNNFKDESLKLILENIELFYQNITINKKRYSTNEDVYLDKGTFIHGIPGLLDNFDWIISNGFISSNFTDGDANKNKIKNSIGMWNIKEDIYLKDYIKKYSGTTITYYIGRGPGSKEVSDLIPYHEFDNYTERINNDKEIWNYSCESTKEVRFIPSLVADKIQIAFILNTNNDIAKKMITNDIWNENLSNEVLEPFIDYRYYPKFIIERFNRSSATTNRESAIVFGLPSSLIEGVFIGRKIEHDQESLNYIHSKLPDCYICNLDGKVLIGNK